MSEGSPVKVEYKTWLGMKERCFNAKNPSFPKYGQKGTVMCKGWSSDFLNFFNDMGNRPKSKVSIDRVDGTGHYSCGHCKECIENGWPMNCRWADWTAQTRNKANNRFLTYKGRTQTVIDWAEEIDLPANTIYRRLQRNWSVEKIIETPHQGVGFKKGWNNSRRRKTTQ